MTVYSWDKGTWKYISSGWEVMGWGKATKDSSWNWTLNNWKSSSNKTSTTTTWGSSKWWSSGWSSSSSWGSSKWWSSGGSSSWGSSSSWANWQYRWAWWTWLTDIDWGTKYANNKTINDMIAKYWKNNVYDALDYISTTWWGNKTQINYLLSWWGSTDLKKNNTINYNANGSQLKNNSSSNNNKKALTESQVMSTISNMKFGKDVNKWYDMTSRNSQIADTMKQMWLDVKDATSVQDFLEKYAPSYKAASDNDKINTANKIFELYSNYQQTTDNNSPIAEEATTPEEAEEWLWTDFDDLLWEILDEENTNEIDNESPIVEEEKEDEEDYSIDEDTQNYISSLESQIEWLNSQLDSLGNWNKVEQFDAEKAAKEARQQAMEEWSAAAWNRAAWEWTEEEAAPQVNNKEQALTSTENYWTYWNKIMNSLSRLWYQLDSGDSNVNEGNMDAVLSWWQPEPTAEEQADVAETEQEQWWFIPSFPNSMELVNNYTSEIDKIAEMWPSKENVEKALKVYLDAKDAAAYYVAHNNWSNQEYNDMLRQIKKNPNFINLLNNFRWWWMKK